MVCHLFPRKILTDCNEIYGINPYSSSRRLLCRLSGIIRSYHPKEYSQ
jgi:hypothetical protein